MRTMTAFLFRNLKGYRLLVILAVGMTFMQVGAEILLGFPLKFITDQFQKRQPPDSLDGFIEFFDRFDGDNHTISVILFSVVMLLILSILSAGLAYIQLYLASFIGQNLTARLRRMLFEHLQRLSLDWHGKQKKGDLVQRITGDIANIEKLVTDGLVDLLSGSLIILGIVVVMALVSPQFTIISLVILPALALVVISYTSGIKAATKKASKAAGQVANVATEDIAAITVLKAFTLEERESLRFTGYVGKNREAGLRAGRLQAQFTPLVTISVAIGTSIILGIGAYVALGNDFRLGPLTISGGSISAGTLVLFLGYLKMFYQPIRDLSKLTNLFTTAVAGAERIDEVFNQAPEVLDLAAPYYGPRRLQGAITFEQVMFGYTPDQPILRGINLHIPAGRKVALVGLSGGGKTTLVKLIPRFYEIQGGSVKLDGFDNRLYPLSVLRQNISLVLQESVLFEGTIRDNIAIGKPGASDAEIINAARQAHIHETIMQLPEGYNSPVREQGHNFSGGQRQRLAIARAILRDAPILILDEPTASLDVEAEAEVMRALATLIVGRTVLMISHRLSTLGNVDEIIVLKEGQIIEQGSFRALKRRGGVFAGLLAEQNRYNLDREANQSIIRPAFAPLQFFQGPEAIRLPPGPVNEPAVPATRNSPAVVPSQQRVATGRSSQPPAQQAQRRGAPQRARLLVEINQKVVRTYQLNKAAMTIGRLAQNDIEVPSSRVSRFHANILWENGIWVLEDAESLNGLTYRGRRTDRVALRHGDRIYISAQASLRYEDGAA